MEKLCFSIIVLILVSCSVPEIKVSKSQDAFGMLNQVASDIKYMKEHHYFVSKQIQINDSLYDYLNKEADWNSEFGFVFKYLSLSKNQLSNFIKDTMTYYNGFKFESYSQTQANQTLKYIEFIRNKSGDLEKVTFIIQENGKINETELSYTYLPKKGYDISSKIKNKLTESNQIEIHAEFLHH